MTTKDITNSKHAAQNQSMCYQSSIDFLPMDKINPSTIEAKTRKSKSILTFDKMQKRDNSMYSTSQLSQNILLENSREQRQEALDERKRNRAKNRNVFGSL